MKYKLLSVHNKDVNNIGDYIQALASSQFPPTIDGFVNRERLDSYKEECQIIMNGWFMHHSENWPPSEYIKPLFRAFHINNSVKNEMLKDEGISYLKKHEPIGCRDTNTVNLLVNKGVNAYFSGCMTLTLGYKFKSFEKDKTCYFVDPVIPNKTSLSSLLSDTFYLIINWKTCRQISIHLFGTNINLRRFIKTGRFYRLYHKFFSQETLINAVFVNQESSFYTTNFPTDETRLKEAERLVRLYSKASLVVTGRIHCALPCLGLETPVVFTQLENDDFISTCRFGGLSDLFNIMFLNERESKLNFQMNSLIDINHTPENKTSWKSIAQKLIDDCKDFVK